MSAIWDTQTSGKDRTFSKSRIQRAHYHPSPLQKLNRDLKETKLSPVREGDQISKPDSSDADFLKGSNVFRRRYVGQLDSSIDSPSLDESWPQSERPSSDEIGDENRSFETNHSNAQTEFKHTTEPDDGPKDKSNSVLSKYIDRFRNAAPLSREERQRRTAANVSEFWWLGDKDSKTGSQDDVVKKSRHPTKHNKKKQELSDDNRWLDERTSLLLQKTDQLLEHTASSLNSLQPAVSTIGLGSDSSANSVVSEEPYRPKFTRTTDMRQPALNPEDDILEQWRWRRRLEQARERVVQADAAVARQQLPKVTDVETSTNALDEFRHKLISYSAHTSDAIETKPAGIKQDAETQVSLDKQAVDICSLPCHHHCCHMVEQPDPCFYLPPFSAAAAAVESVLVTDDGVINASQNTVQGRVASHHQQSHGQRMSSLHQSQCSESDLDVTAVKEKSKTVKFRHERAGRLKGPSRSAISPARPHTSCGEYQHDLPVNSTLSRRAGMQKQASCERLFDASDSFTIISSVESLRDGSYSVKEHSSPQQSQHEPADSQPEPVEDLEAFPVSDGEEFSDDAILKDLRQRRATYLRLLHQLDEAIRLDSSR